MKNFLKRLWRILRTPPKMESSSETIHYVNSEGKVVKTETKSRYYRRY